jgi:hypothetical protein
MHVQTFVLSFAIAASGLVPLACLAQQPPGAATLETSVSGDDSKAKTAGTVRPAGTLVRPQDGVQHPDLDKAWTEYDAAVAKVTESIKASIAKQFDAATEKGDLDAAEKWQIALQKFDENGQLPSESGTRAVASAAATELKAAKDSLEEAYGTVVKALTREKKIAEAKAVRSEAKAINNPDLGEPNRPAMPHIPTPPVPRQKIAFYIAMETFGVDGGEWGRKMLSINGVPVGELPALGSDLWRPVSLQLPSKCIASLSKGASAVIACSADNTDSFKVRHLRLVATFPDGRVVSGQPTSTLTSTPRWQFTEGVVFSSPSNSGAIPLDVPREVIAAAVSQQRTEP